MANANKYPDGLLVGTIHSRRAFDRVGTSHTLLPDVEVEDSALAGRHGPLVPFDLARPLSQQMPRFPPDVLVFKAFADISRLFPDIPG